MSGENRPYFMSILRYDSGLGLFYWRESRGRVAADTIAGSINDAGYVCICIDGIFYRAHRLAWLFQYGSWPKYEIDHINRIKNDNRIANLRQATKNQNQANSKIRSDNKGGLKGVTWLPKSKKWMARIKINKKTTYLGSFVTKEKAHRAYLVAAREHFGEYASGG